MNKSTPGPWQITDTLGQTAITIPHAKIGIAFDTICHISGNIRKGNYEANARLIAAAPELLEACRKAKWLYDELSLGTLEAACKYGDQYEPPTKEECLEIRQMLEQAIAKAEGGK